MKVCLLATPISIHTRRWINDYVALGHEVHIITHHFNAEENPKVSKTVENAEVHEINSTKFLKRFIAPLQVRRLINKIDTDVVHAHYIASYGVYGALSGFHPLVVSAWGSDIETSEGSGVKPWPDKYEGVMRPLIMYTVQQADIVHTVAKHLSRRCEDLGSSPEKIIMFPRHPDPDKFNLNAEPAIEEDNVVISVRPFKPLYSLETLIKAAPKVIEEIPNVKFLFMGTNTDSPALKKNGKIIRYF